MNEEQIQKQLLENKLTYEIPQQSVVQPSNDQSTNTLNNIRMMEFFNVSSFQKNTPELQEMISNVMDWGSKMSQSNDFNDIIVAIQKQINMMGINFREDKLNRLHNYIKLKSELNRVESQIGSLYE